MDFQKYIEDIRNWGCKEDSIKAIILVGSYAKGTYKPTSDIDFCVLTTEKQNMLANLDLFSQFGEIVKHQTEYYGAVTSLRVWYKDGFEVEYGIAKPSWISLPLDDGTKKVLTDGYKVILDKNDYFKTLNRTDQA